MYLDEDLHDTVTLFNLNVVAKFSSNEIQTRTENKLTSIETLFLNSSFNRKKLYTYFSYILVTYLGRYMRFDKSGDVQQVSTKKLSCLMSLLFTYISDINGDFFRTSLKLLKPNYLYYYKLKQENVLNERAQ